VVQSKRARTQDDEGQLDLRKSEDTGLRKWRGEAQTQMGKKGGRTGYVLKRRKGARYDGTAIINIVFEVRRVGSTRGGISHAAVGVSQQGKSRKGTSVIMKQVHKLMGEKRGVWGGVHKISKL